MAEVTVYSNAHPESASVDGRAFHHIWTGLPWLELKAAPGSGFADDGDNLFILMYGSTTDDKFYMINRVFLLFNTSIIPEGAIILSAKLRICISSQENAHLYPDYKLALVPSTPASNIQLEAADYQRVGSTLLSDDLALITDYTEAGGYFTFNLNVAGLLSINKEGITKLGLREYYYDILGNIPPYHGYLRWGLHVNSADHIDLETRPQLTIAYLSDAPTVITKAATDIEKRAAWAVGMITDIGGGSVDYVGFDWGLTPAYGDSFTWAGSFLADVDFTHHIEDLEIGTTYHFRAKAHNEAGWGYGQDLTFTTLGVAYPTKAITRVAGLIHRWRPGQYILEMALGDITADFGTMPLSPMVTVPPTPLVPLPLLPAPPAPTPTPTLPPPLPSIGPEPYVPTYHWLRTYYFTLSALQVGYAEYKKWMAAAGKTPDTFEEYCRAVGRWDELKRLEHLANITPGI